MKFYKWLCDKTSGGRQWTYIYRDFYHEVPYFVQFIWYNIGLWVGIFWDWRIAYIVWGVYTIGFIYGHFHWGTKWVKGQGGDNNGH